MDVAAAKERLTQVQVSDGQVTPVQLAPGLSGEQFLTQAQRLPVIFQRASRVRPVLQRHTKLIVSAREIIADYKVIRLFSCQSTIERTRLTQILKPTCCVAGVLELAANLHIAICQAALVIHIARIDCDQCFTNSERLLVTVECARYIA